MARAETADRQGPPAQDRSERALRVIALVYGTTAELIKLAPVYRRLDEIGARPLLWCTGQQAEELPEISERLGIPQPDVWLGRGVRGRSLSRTWDVPPWLWSVIREARRQRETSSARRTYR